MFSFALHYSLVLGLVKQFLFLLLFKKKKKKKKIFVPDLCLDAEKTGG